jgi:hypothetical protein
MSAEFSDLRHLRVREMYARARSAGLPPARDSVADATICNQRSEGNPGQFSAATPRPVWRGHQPPGTRTAGRVPADACRGRGSQAGSAATSVSRHEVRRADRQQCHWRACARPDRIPGSKRTWQRTCRTPSRENLPPARIIDLASPGAIAAPLPFCFPHRSRCDHAPAACRGRPARSTPLTTTVSCNHDVQSQKETRKNYSMTNGIAPQMHPFGVTSVAILRSSVRCR